MDCSSWRNSILNQIQLRNKQQFNTFEDLITSHNRLFDTHAALRLENEKLRSERLSLPRGSIESQGVPERISILESKLLAQQEELTELHRKRGENAQMVVDLNRKLQEKADQLKVAEDSLAESSAIITTLKQELQSLLSQKIDLEKAIQLIRDEHTTLQLTCSHLEDKLRKTQDENRELVDRLMKYKSKDAEKMNEENDKFLKKRYAKIQRELEEAAKDSSRNVSLDTYAPDIPYSEKSAVPTKPTYIFDAHEGEVSAVKWSPVDRIVATGGADRKVKLWDTSKNAAESRGVLVGSNAGVLSVNFDSTGSFILGASNDFATRVWGVSDQRLKKFVYILSKIQLEVNIKQHHHLHAVGYLMGKEFTQ
ncbi:hypothetical protein GE061_010865 [Apolygus lucorum]|uniref:Autophagy-related protein 16 domain-containing protein n=1 Tax=Apolygus lucorum TaxID=248454 RepID=A0A6A4JVH8_APOLU|nr:hypothetical protein GE061_010865 [Apolygus lucorum]